MFYKPFASDVIKFRADRMKKSLHSSYALASPRDERRTRLIEATSSNVPQASISTSHEVGCLSIWIISTKSTETASRIDVSTTHHWKADVQSNSTRNRNRPVISDGRRLLWIVFFRRAWMNVNMNIDIILEYFVKSLSKKRINND